MNFRHYAGLSLLLFVVLIVCIPLVWGIHETEPIFKVVFGNIEWAAGNFLVAFFDALIVCLVIGILGSITYVILRAKSAYGWHAIKPNRHGNYAQMFDGKSGRLVSVAPGNHAKLPETFSYHNAPRVTSVKEEPRDESLVDVPQLERAAPRLDDFYDAIPYNSLQTGLGAKLGSGELVTASIEESVHYKLIGGSGFGKSCLAAGMLDIATTTNSPDMLRIALLDLEWKTARLFEQVPHVLEVRSHGRTIRMIGRDADEVAARLGTLKLELDRRSSTGINTPLLLIYVEEMLALQYEVDPELQKRMLADLNILALRGRKYGIFFLACMQTDYSTKELREAKGQFRTRAGFAIDTKAAQASGFVNTELVKQNFRQGRPGQYLLEKPAFSELVLAPRYDVTTKLASKPTSTVTTNDIFFDMVDATPDVVTTQPVKPVDVTMQPEMSTRSIKVVEMLRQECGQNEILKEVWGVSSKDGRPYREAVAEYRHILAKVVGGDPS